MSAPPARAATLAARTSRGVPRLHTATKAAACRPRPSAEPLPCARVLQPPCYCVGAGGRGGSGQASRRSNAPRRQPLLRPRCAARRATARPLASTALNGPLVCGLSPGVAGFNFGGPAQEARGAGAGRARGRWTRRRAGGAGGEGRPAQPVVGQPHGWRSQFSYVEVVTAACKSLGGEAPWRVSKLVTMTPCPGARSWPLTP
jgi:hypothetical protein